MADEYRLTVFQKRLIFFILLFALVGLGYGLLRERGLDGSALLYIGMPTMIAVVFATASPAKSIVGSTLKAITLIILMSGPVLQEGFVCMVLAAPILYIVGALAAWPFDYYRKKKAMDKKASKLNVMILPSILMLLSMEGTMEELTFDRYNIVERSQVVNESVDEIRQRLGGNRKLSTPDSLFTQLFPRPTMVRANGLEVGNTQIVDLSYFKWLIWNEKRGATIFEVVENTPYKIRFRPKNDDSYITTYLKWGDTEVFFHPLNEGRTRVTWRVHFTRKLDPAWYVQPLQRYVVGDVADLMIESLK